MHKEHAIVVDALPVAADELCRKFGFWKSTLALIAAARRRRRIDGQLSHFSNRLRRDVGLPEVYDPRGEATFTLWDIRL
ncbi:MULTISPECIES: DUF1127 domain-containing protein [Ciceribacter]|uniref:DUF1127 domain-containing protein n=1 Tax=Ciceribacter lividus TaxID=1197950 RepID=A0A6I7HHW2_9HYPH|nr:MULTISPECIES: DUF1127 domain-containing protein [Ciceribacter]MCO6177524.1 DUF1127 domain-containing protein [Ciceribacter sp. RN22]RCW20243.1 hypothetical protein DFR48_115107 [Ciceribacter lividus]